MILTGGCVCVGVGGGGNAIAKALSFCRTISYLFKLCFKLTYSTLKPSTILPMRLSNEAFVLVIVCLLIVSGKCTITYALC